MSLLNYFDFNLSQFLIILFIVFIASIIRGFNGFGFSATCMSLISFILPAIEIVPIILILEVMVVILQLRGYSNKKINILPVKFLAGGVSGIINGLGTLGGMPISLFLLITKVKPIVIRGS